MAALGQLQPVATSAGFSTWQPAKLSQTAGFGQNQPFNVPI
jgi:hypothetical protein